MESEAQSLRPEDLIRYVPAHVVKRIARGESAVAFSEELPAAALFADISGFTALSERLAVRGPEGVEELTETLNAYFGRLIGAVTMYGGDVVKFAGDALLAFWPVDNDGAALDQATHIAARCAATIQDSLSRFDVQGAERLSLRVGVGAGTVIAASLGGVYGRYEFVLSGPAVIEATKSAAEAQPGFCVIGPEAQKRATPKDAMDLPEPAPLPALDASAVPSLLAYIPRSIHRRLAAGQSGWLAELRSLTVIFAKLPVFGAGADVDTKLSVMRAVQTELYRYEGSVNKLSVDEKGVMMLAALGLPPLSHEDDARRATLAAMDIRARLEELGQPTSIGVNSGNVFCGTIGDATRCEYTLIGDAVNVSARLMQAAAGRVLCGETTRKAAGERIKWEPLEPITVKGKAHPLPVFRPLRPAWTQATRMTEVTGRAAERSRIEARLDALQGGTGGVLLIEGEAGIGKSTLVQWMHAAAEERAIVVLRGAADAAQASTPYFAWRPVFRDLLAIDESEPIETRRAKVLAQLGDAETLAPLLEPLVALGLTDNVRTAAMFGEVRSNNTVTLLVRLLRERTVHRPHLIVLEDAHWFDSASWTLAVRAADEVPSSLLSISTRPLSDPVPRPWTQLRTFRNTEQIALGPLGPEDSLELVRRRLGVDALPPPVADFLRDRAGGNPFFVQEIASALVESGRIVVDGRHCQLAAGDKLTALPFPDTVQGVVTSRIDRLPAPEQLTLKVASVIGRTFTEPVLADVYPIQEHRASQARHLDALVSTRLVEHESVSYTFCHAITQDVAYQLMAPAQRRELHGSVARWYENEYALELAPFYPLLAKHWTAADSPAHAIDYLEKSGQAALRDHANEEALEFFEQALSMTDREKIDDQRRASWLRACAEAHYNLGRLDKSLEVYREAVALLGWPLPRTKTAWVMSTIRELAVQTLHRYFPSRFLGRARERERTHEAACSYVRLTEIYYLNNEKLETIHAAFRALNLAEDAGQSAELARCYANIAIVTGLMMMHGTARRHADRALATAEAVNHPPSTAYVRFIRGSYLMTIGEWPEAESDLRIAVRTAERVGDRRCLHESSGILSHALARSGKVVEARTVAGGLFEAATRRSLAQVQVWASAWAVWCDLLLGESAVESEEEATLAEICLRRSAELALADRIFGAGILALVRFRRGDRDGALEAANAAEVVIAATDQVAHYLLEPYLALAATYNGLWPEQPREMRKRLRRVAKLADRYAMMYPIGKPAALLVRAWIAEREGETARAATLYSRSADAAHRFAMPMFEAAAREHEIAPPR